jgi:hypothetical protein
MQYLKSFVSFTIKAHEMPSRKKFEIEGTALGQLTGAYPGAHWRTFVSSENTDL